MDLYLRYLATGFAYHQLLYLKSLSSLVSTMSLKSIVGNRWRNLVASRRHWILGNYLCGVLIVPRWYIFDPWYIEWSNSKASPSNRFSGPLYFIITGGYSTVTLNSMGLTCSSPKGANLSQRAEFLYFDISNSLLLLSQSFFPEMKRWLSFAEGAKMFPGPVRRRQVVEVRL